MTLDLSLIGEPRGSCPVCGTSQCTCRGQNEPFVGRPIDLAFMSERPDGSVTRVRATEKIWRDKPGLPGAKELLYNEGDFIREEDIDALGLRPQAKAAKAPAQDKAARGPREAPKKPRNGRRKASRDKAMNEEE